jgi:hypothetical protein
MIDAALIAMASLAGGLTFILFVASRAPLGYQDQAGFHFGPDGHEPTEDFDEAFPELSR